MPLIGTGVAGWPKQLAAELCLTEVSLFLRAGPSSLKVTVMVSCPVVAVYIVTCCSKRQRCKNPKVSRFVGQQPLLPPRIISKQLVHCLALPCLHFLRYFCRKLHHWLQAPANPLLPPPPPAPSRGSLPSLRVLFWHTSLAWGPGLPSSARTQQGISMPSCRQTSPYVQVVRFVDLNDEAIAALQAALQVQLQQAPHRLIFLGRPDSCTSAMQDVQQRIEVAN